VQHRAPRPHARAIHALWDELADFPASRSDAGLEHLMRSLCRWLRADNAFWVGAVRMTDGDAAKHDPQHGWRGRAVRPLRPGPAIDARLRQALREQDTAPPLTLCALTARAGAFRVHRMHDGFIDLAAFRRTGHYRRFYEAPGVTDRLWAAAPIGRDAESWLVFDRIRKARPFSAGDAALAASALGGIKWFHRQLLLSHGLPLTRDPLPPAQRRVLLQLLGGRTEKHIAEELGLTAGTTHQYTVALYRKFAVKGRAELAALWLGG